jgi:hypothetical protein
MFDNKRDEFKAAKKVVAAISDISLDIEWVSFFISQHPPAVQRRIFDMFLAYVEIKSNVEMLNAEQIDSVSEACTRVKPFL